MSMENSKNCNVLGIGDVCLRFSSGSVFTLKNVRHVPDLRYNLLSCASLKNDGLEGKWGKGVMKILRGSLIIFTAKKMNNLYVCHAETACDSMNSVLSDSLCKSNWLVDSGCTFHVTPFRDLFSCYKEIEHGFVSMANSKNCNVLGICDVCLKFSSGYVFTLKNVRHVPDLRNNLLSCASLENDGLEGK